MLLMGHAYLTDAATNSNDMDKGIKLMSNGEQKLQTLLEGKLGNEYVLGTKFDLLEPATQCQE